MYISKLLALAGGFGIYDCAGRQGTAKSSKRTSQSFWLLLAFLVLLTLLGENSTPPKAQNVHLKVLAFAGLFGVYDCAGPEHHTAKS